jgi:tricorn protease
VDIEGGFPKKLPYPRASHLAWEPDGNRVALVRNNLGWVEWNRYRGGEADKIWVGDPSVPEFTLVSNHDGNESWPMWHPNGRIYFVADIGGRENIWSMNPDGEDLRAETELETFDVRYPRMRGNKIIFQHGADLATCDVTTGEVTHLELKLPSSMLQANQKFLDPNDWVDSWTLNAEGTRLLVETRGELFTLPVKAEGLIRRWTRSSGSREQSPHFLPGGSVVAITDQTGEQRVVKIPGPGKPMSGFDRDSRNDWKDLVIPSPDGRYAALATGDQKLWLLDLKKETRTLIDEGGWEFTEMAWSPMGRYLAFVHVEGEAERNILFIYDAREDESHQISDPMINTASPAWDPNGKYLYVVSDRDFSFTQDYNRALFTFDGTGVLGLYRLRSRVPSPFVAKGDEAGDGLPDAPWLDTDPERGEDDPVEVEFEGITERIERIPVDGGRYGGLSAVSNKLYVVDYEYGALKLYDLESRELSTVVEGVSSYELSPDGSTVVVRKGSSWYWGQGGSSSLSTDSDHQVSTHGWTMDVDPQAEWRQILREAWRLQRDFFYDEAHHGIDWEEVLSRYSTLLERVRTRDDLNDLMREIQAEQATGHSFIRGGDVPEIDGPGTGMLGADLVPDPSSGYYRIDRVISPLPGSEDGASPLHDADPRIGRGTYILEVDGQPARAAENIYRLLVDRAGVPTSILVSDSPDRKRTRELIVRPLGSETYLRMDDWAYSLRDYVREKSDGKVGYVFLPDMSFNGMWRWGRDYYPQKHLQGMIIDDRYNSGGNISEMLLKEMSSPIHTLQGSRYGAFQTKPHGSFFGHPVFLINGVTFSDGEMLAHAVKTVGYGTLMGTRTSGGGVWLWARRRLMDDGFIVVPEFGNWSATTGDWVIEATGVSPEIEVINDPESELLGEDRQLDAAIDLILEKIEKDPRRLPERPKTSPIH